MIALIGLAAGVLLALLLHVEIPLEQTALVAVVLVVCIYRIFDGIVRLRQNSFRLAAFTLETVTDLGLGLLLAYIGKMIEIDLYLAVIIVFAIKIFQKFTIIQRFLLKLWKKRGMI